MSVQSIWEMSAASTMGPRKEKVLTRDARCRMADSSVWWMDTRLEERAAPLRERARARRRVTKQDKNCVIRTNTSRTVGNSLARALALFPCVSDVSSIIAAGCGSGDASWTSAGTRVARETGHCFIHFVLLTVPSGHLSGLPLRTRSLGASPPQRLGDPAYSSQRRT